MSAKGENEKMRIDTNLIIGIVVGAIGFAVLRSTGMLAKVGL